MTVYAESVNYWKTSKSRSAETWIDLAKREIVSIGGKVLSEAFGADATGKSAFMLNFCIGSDTFKIVWPALPSKTKNDKAAKIQAATLLYHDVKHKVVMAKIKGVRTAFFEYFLLPDGQTAAQVAGDQLLSFAPIMMLPSGK